jgi:peptidoglycan/xylan/chitin deacetylase (PgdA/CDA1 family)
MVKMESGKVRLSLLQHVILVAGLLLDVNLSTAQLPQGYEVATWYKFHKSAITYTFDDNTPNQLGIAIPMLDRYDFRCTMFVPTDWVGDWNGLIAAHGKGHEITSHTVSHPRLGDLAVPEQESELKNSKEAIVKNVNGARSMTLAYPFCNVGNLDLVKKYYLAARICSNAIVSSTPEDFYYISSIPVGSETQIKTAKDLNISVGNALSSNGWCVLLLHGIDRDGGYSPLSSEEFESHLEYVRDNSANFWVSTFADVVKYIKERNAIFVTEESLKKSKISFTCDDKLDDSQFNIPVTLRRVLPENWAHVTVRRGNTELTSHTETLDNRRYVVFDVVPNNKVITISREED